MKPTRRSSLIALVLTGLLVPLGASAQITNVVFSDDFSKAGIDTNKYAIDAPFFEGGKGTIAPKVENGVLEFTGEVTERWWAGATLRVAQTFPISPETNVLVTVDRVAENGTGTSTRSALWLMDPTRTKYVLFADNTKEGGWQYNRKLGVAGDVPTGGGTALTAFQGTDANTGVNYDDLGQHQMAALFNGTDVRLYLDGVFGATVSFPFSGVVVEMGSYARDGPPDTPDTADTIWDNLKIANVGSEAFSASSLALVSGQTASNVTVRIPAGVNQSQAVQVKVISSDPTVAIPTGATGDTLTLTFAAGGPREQALSVTSVAPGGAVFTLTNSIGMGTANQLGVVVIEAPGVRLSEDFAAATPDATKWRVNTNAFEVGVGTFTVAQTGGQLVISGTTDQQQYWAGASLKTVKSYTAIPDVPLAFDIDRVSIDATKASDASADTGARTGVFITTDDRSKYVFFAQDVGETGWEVNVSPGSTATGSGTAIPQFASITDTGSHHMRLVADGSNVEVFLDGKSGGKFPFPVTAGIHFEVGAYARALDDSVKGVFDNAKIENIVPPVSVTTLATDVPNSITTPLGVDTNTVTITIPRFLTTSKAATVSITSQDPKVAVPAGAANGTLALQFGVGATNVQTVRVATVGVGTTTFTITNDQSVAVDNHVLPITVTSPMVPVFTDTFSTLDTNKNWTVDTTPLDPVTPGTLTADSGLSVTNGMLNESVIDDTANWPGLNLKTAKSFSASLTSPLWFDVDRRKLDFKLVTGTGAQERSGIWVYDSTGTNYVFFNEYLTHSGTIQGWEYNRGSNGQTNDIPVPAAGTLIPAFQPAGYNDQGNHHMKIVANGTDLKLYLDGLYGASVPFPYTNGITFGIGTYVYFNGTPNDTANGYYANVVISGPGAAPVSIGPLTAAKQANGQVMISWTGAGTLQSTTGLPGGWTDVTPAPATNSYTVAPTAQKQQFFRLRQ